MTILNLLEKQQIQIIINNMVKGDYELKDIYGSLWQSINSPTTHGANFKETVQAGHLQNIRHNSVRSDNHNIYSIK